MAKRRSVASIILGWLAGLFFMLILLALANWLVPLFLSGFPVELLHFLNGSVVVLLLISFLFFLGDLFWAFRFPFDLPAPIPRAIGAVFLLYFLAHLLAFIDVRIASDFYFIIEPFMGFLYGFVFVVVLVVGYIAIFMRLVFGGKKRDDDDDD